MNKKVKEALKAIFKNDMKQIAPYVVEFDSTNENLRSYLVGMAETTGSTFKYLAEGKKGRSIYKVSDPLCKILEDTGMNA